MRVDIQDGVVVNAWTQAELFRGFEVILRDKDPQAGLVVTPRACGICGASHLTCAAWALDTAWKTEVPRNAILARNLGQIVESIQSLPRHHYGLFMIDLEKVEMLMEIAMGLQTRPRTIADLQSALRLYEEALKLCPQDQPLVRARIEARKGTAHQAVPSSTHTMLEAARDCFERAKPVLQQQGSAEELAELEMNLGLVLQSLAGMRRAKITDAISAYQRSLRTFNRPRIPKSSRSCKTISRPPSSRSRSPTSAPRCARRSPCRRSRKG